MKTIVLCLIAAPLWLTSTMVAGDLDAPALKAVTVRSEIERGMDAINHLPVFQPRLFGDAVRHVISENKQRNTDTDGFQYGANYAAWHRAWTTASIGFKDPVDRRLAELDAEIFFMMASKLREQLGLSLAEAKELAGVYYDPDEESRFPEILKTKKFKDSTLREVEIRRSADAFLKKKR